MKKINVNQTSVGVTEKVTSTFIEDVKDIIPEVTSDSYIKGNISSDYGYKSSIETINRRFPNLNINCTHKMEDDEYLYPAELKVNIGIKGNTVVMNQRLPNKNVFPDSKTVKGVTYTTDADKRTVTLSGTATEQHWAAWNFNFLNMVVGHKYLACGLKNTNANISVHIQSGKLESGDYDDRGNGQIFVPAEVGFLLWFNIYPNSNVDGITYTPRLIDLTQMFGAGNEPSTVDKFAKRMGYNSIDEVPYIPYTEGTIIDNTVQQLQITNHKDRVKTSIDLSSIMQAHFPQGLKRVGDVYDEITSNKATKRISNSNEVLSTPEEYPINPPLPLFTKVSKGGSIKATSDNPFVPCTLQVDNMLKDSDITLDRVTLSIDNHVTKDTQDVYIDFEDSSVNSIIKNKCSTDNIGVTIPNVSSLNGTDTADGFNRWFRNNATIKKFNQFNKFKFNTDSVYFNSAFSNATGLESITLPYATPVTMNSMFLVGNGAANAMTSIDISNIDYSKRPDTSNMFDYRSNLETVIGIDRVTYMGNYMLRNTKVNLRSLSEATVQSGTSGFPYSSYTVQTYPLYNSKIFAWRGAGDDELPITNFEDNNIKISNYKLTLKNNQIFGAYALYQSKLKEVTNFNQTDLSGQYPLSASDIEKVTLNDDITSLNTAIFGNAYKLSDVDVSNITTINSSWATGAVKLGVVFKKLTTINSSALAIHTKYIVLDQLQMPITFTQSGNTTDRGYKIYVPDVLLNNYRDAAGWNILYNLGVIKSMTDFLNDFPEEADKIDNKPELKSISFGGYPLDVVPVGLKTPLNVEIISQGVKSVIWSNTFDKHYKNQWAIDTSASTADLGATNLLDSSITIRRAVSVVSNELFISKVKEAYPSYASVIEANKEQIIKNPNLITMLGKTSTIHIDQTQSDPKLMVTGDTAINEGFDDTINVISWIRNNSHCYVIENYTEQFDVQQQKMVPHANLRQLSDYDKSKYADGTNAPVTTKDVVMKLPKFYFKIVGSNYDETSKCNLDFDISFATYKVDNTWVEWDDTQMIGVYEAYATEGNTSSGNIQSISGQVASNNISYNSFKGKCNVKGEGYRLINFEAHSMMGILFYAYYGNTHSQSIGGSGTGNYPKMTGTKDFLGMRDTSNLRDGNVDSINFWGLENWWGDLYEWIDNLYTVGSWTAQGCKAYDIAMWEKGINTSSSQVQTTSKLIFNSPVTGQEISKIDFTDGLLIPKAQVNNGNYNTYYADSGGVNGGAGNVAVRSFYSSSAYGGVAFFNAYYGPGYAYANVGARLLYKGTYDIIK